MAWLLTNLTTAVDMSAGTEAASLQLIDRAYANASRLSGRIRDEAGTLSLIEDHEVQLQDGATVIFAGVVRSLEQTDTGVSSQRIYGFDALDYTTYLADDVIDAGVRNVTETDKARITWAFATFGTKGITVGASVVQLAASIGPGDYTGLNLHQFLTEIAKLTSGSFYVDYSKVLHYFNSETNPASFGLSDTPNGTTTFGFENFNRKRDTVEYVNAVYVIGTGISGWRTLGATPIATLRSAGTLRATVLNDPEITDAATLNARGDSIIASFGKVLQPSNLATYTPGLRAGQYVAVTHSGWGLSAVNFRIAGITARPATKGRIRYEVDFGDSPVELGSFMSGQAQAIASIGASVAGAYVGDTVPPATPTGLALSTTTRKDAAGIDVPILIASWTANIEGDLEAYELQLARAIEGDVTFSVSASGTGGALAAGQYNVDVTALGVDGGESASLGYKSITITAGQRIFVNITPKSGASSYKIYVSRSGSAPPKTSGQTTVTTGSNVEATPEGAGATSPALSTALAFIAPSTYRTNLTSITIEDVQGGYYYGARLRAIDKSGNPSGWGSVATVTTAPDTVAPAIPTGVSATPGYKLVAVTWSRSSSSDIDHYEVRWSSDGGTTWQASISTLTNLIVVQGLSVALYSFEVRAIDRSGNVDGSPGSPGVAVNAVLNPDAGWSAIVTATPSLIGAADVAFNSVLTGILTANAIDASTITTGALTIGAQSGLPDYLLVYNAIGQEIGRWDSNGLVVKDPTNTARQLRFVNGVMSFTSDNGVTWSTAISADGIDATRVTFGSAPGGHNSIPNSSFELSAFATTLARLWTAAADWAASIAASDVNVTKTGASLTLTSAAY